MNGRLDTMDEDRPQEMNKPLLCLAVGAGAGMAMGGALGGLVYFIIGLCAGAGAGFAVGVAWARPGGDR